MVPRFSIGFLKFQKGSLGSSNGFLGLLIFPRSIGFTRLDLVPKDSLVMFRGSVRWVPYLPGFAWMFGVEQGVGFKEDVRQNCCRTSQKLKLQTKCCWLRHFELLEVPDLLQTLIVKSRLQHFCRNIVVVS